MTGLDEGHRVGAVAEGEGRADHRCQRPRCDECCHLGVGLRSTAPGHAGTTELDCQGRRGDAADDAGRPEHRGRLAQCLPADGVDQPVHPLGRNGRDPRRPAGSRRDVERSQVHDQSPFARAGHSDDTQVAKEPELDGVAADPTTGAQNEQRLAGLQVELIKGVPRGADRPFRQKLKAR